MEIVELPYNVEALSGKLAVPGDKSISHRSIMFGALAKGKTTVTNFLFGDDCISTMRIFQQLGVEIEVVEESIVIHGNGFDGLKEPKSILDVGTLGQPFVYYSVYWLAVLFIVVSLVMSPLQNAP